MPDQWRVPTGVDHEPEAASVHEAGDDGGQQRYDARHFEQASSLRPHVAAAHVVDHETEPREGKQGKGEVDDDWMQREVEHSSRREGALASGDGELGDHEGVDLAVVAVRPRPQLDGHR